MNSKQEGFLHNRVSDILGKYRLQDIIEALAKRSSMQAAIYRAQGAPMQGGDMEFFAKELDSLYDRLYPLVKNKRNPIEEAEEILEAYKRNLRQR